MERGGVTGMVSWVRQAFVVKLLGCLMILWVFFVGHTVLNLSTVTFVTGDVVTYYIPKNDEGTESQRDETTVLDVPSKWVSANISLENVHSTPETQNSSKEIPRTIDSQVDGTSVLDVPSTLISANMSVENLRSTPETQNASKEIPESRDNQVDGPSVVAGGDSRGWRNKSQGLLDELSSGTFDQNGTWHVNNTVYTKTRGELLESLRGKRIIFYGTSFMRELYFETLSLLQNSEPTSPQKFIPSYDSSITRDKNCTSKRVLPGGYCVQPKPGTKICNLPGPAGINLKRCGAPHNGMFYSREFDVTIYFQFKTYLYTPEADDIVLEHLKRNKYEFMVLGSAEWGKNKHTYKNMSYDEQAKNFYDRLFSVFKGKRMYVYHKYNTSTEAQRKYIRSLISGGDSSTLFVDMTPFVKSADKLHLKPNGHGFSGPRTNATMRTMLLVMANENL